MPRGTSADRCHSSRVALGLQVLLGLGHQVAGIGRAGMTLLIHWITVTMASSVDGVDDLVDERCDGGVVVHLGHFACGREG